MEEKEVKEEIKSDAFVKHIRLDIIQPDYEEEIKNYINGRNGWRKVGLCFETSSKIFLGIGSVVSFASGVYQNTTLSFIAGSISTISLVCLQFSTYSFSQSKRSTNRLNLLLSELKLEAMPDLTDKTN